MEADAALHVTAVDPGLHIAVPWRAREPGGTEPARPALPATIGPAEQPPPASPTTLLRWTDRTSAALWSAHLCSATKAAISEPGS